MKRISVLAAGAAMLLVAAPAMAALGKPAPAAQVLQGTTRIDGLLPVHVDAGDGRILLSLPAPGADGIAGRYIYATALRTGIGSAPIGLDRAMQGPTQLLVFRRIAGKIAIQFENPRFRATGAPAAEQAAARDSFAFTTAWIGDIAAIEADGRLIVDISGFLKRDVIGIADALGDGSGKPGSKGYAQVEELGIADPAAVKVFPDNIELEALQTYRTGTPGDEVANIAPDARQVSVIVHHSLIRLPDAGYVPRRFDPRAGGFASQAIDFGVPLGGDVVYDLANRFRLDKIDPSAPRSRVKKPIIFYIDRSAPEPIRSALADGVRWWADAFDAAGYVDAFRVEILPEGIDPLDIRYNVVNWVNRATRGWSYGQVVADPRTGEIIKGSVLLGSLRVRQDMLIFEGLAGAAAVGSGGPNDPVVAALARLRQLAAHEVGHALGLVHNFAASTQDRASVMDYPAPRIGLVDGAPDLSDAYGVGVGQWDRFAIDWLYGAPPPGTDVEAAARAKADASVATGLRFVTDADARDVRNGQPWGSMWDDGPDPVVELRRMIAVRRAAIARFGPAALKPGEPLANLRRKFVPIWLLDRYQVDATAKLIGGVDYRYALNGEAANAAPAVPEATQRDALAALLDTLSPENLTVPRALLPLLSSAMQGNTDRQSDIEVWETAGGPVFDALLAADVRATVTLDALLAPDRLDRLYLQHVADPAALGLDDLIGALLSRTIAAAGEGGVAGDTGRRVAWRTLASVAGVRDGGRASPEVTAVLDGRLRDAAAKISRSKDVRLQSWGRQLARALDDGEAMRALLATSARPVPVPPGMPIGGAEGD